MYYVYSLPELNGEYHDDEYYSNANIRQTNRMFGEHIAQGNVGAFNRIYSA